MRRCVTLTLTLMLKILLTPMIEQLSQSQVGRVTPVRAIVAAGQRTARPTCAAELMHVSSHTAVCGFNPPVAVALRATQAKFK